MNDTLKDLPESAQKLIRKLRDEVRLEKARRVGAMKKLSELHTQNDALRAELEAGRGA